MVGVELDFFDARGQIYRNREKMTIVALSCVLHQFAVADGRVGGRGGEDSPDQKQREQEGGEPTDWHFNILNLWLGVDLPGS